jgi:hypothetical protein
VIRDAQLASDARPSYRRLALVRAAWLALCLLILAAFSIGQWFLYAELQLPCGGAACAADPFYLTAGEIADMQASGYAPEFYASAQVILYVIFFFVHLGLATLIFWRQSSDRMAMFVAVALLLWSGMFPDVPKSMWSALPWLAKTLSFGAAIGGLGFYLFLFLFPNGRFASAAMRWFALLMVLYAVFTSGTVLSMLPSGSLAAFAERNRPLFFMVFIAAAIWTQIYRYRWLSNAVERQQTRWALYGIVIGLSWIMG